MTKAEAQKREEAQQKADAEAQKKADAAEKARLKAERQAAEKEKQRLAVERQKAQKEEAAAAAESSSSPTESLKDVDIKLPEIKAPELPDIKVPDIKVGERNDVTLNACILQNRDETNVYLLRYLRSRCPRLMFQTRPSSMHRSLMLLTSRFRTSK